MRRPLAEGRKQREASAQALSGALAWSAGCATQGRWSHHMQAAGHTTRRAKLSGRCTGTGGAVSSQVTVNP